MTTYYLDTSAVGNEYQSHSSSTTADAMTWTSGATDKPKPQDGNGKASSAASSAVAIAEIKFNAQPADGKVISMTGLSGGFTAKATAYSAANQFLIGATIADTIANLVACINLKGSSTSVANNNRTMAAGCSQALLDATFFMYARVKPGATDTIQIATRFAGSDMNQSQNSNMTITASATWNGTDGTQQPTVTEFTGGTDGPFAYYINAAAVFGKAAFTYGLYCSKSGASLEPAATGLDPIIVRTMRSAANIALNLVVASGNLTVTGVTGVNRTFVFDDGTTWASGNGQFQVLAECQSGLSVLQVKPASGTHYRFEARAKYGYRLLFKMASNSGLIYVAAANAAGAEALFINCEVGAYDSTTLFGLLATSSGVTISSTYIGCKLVIKRNNLLTVYTLDANYSIILRTIDCDIEYTIGTTVSNLLGFNTQPTNTPANLFQFQNTRFSVDGGANGIGAIFTGGSTIAASSLCTIIFDNCKGLPGSANSGVGFASTYSGTWNQAPQFLWLSDKADAGFRHELPWIICDWDTVTPYPTLSATTPDGALFSMRVQWQVNRMANIRRPLSFGKFSAVWSGSDAALTVDLEVYLATAEVPTKAQLFCTLKYTDTSGVSQYATSEEAYGVHLMGTATALAAGVGGWNANGYASHGSYRVRFTTSSAVKSGTKVEVEGFLMGPPITDRNIYVNPELLLAAA